MRTIQRMLQNRSYTTMNLGRLMSGVSRATALHPNGIDTNPNEIIPATQKSAIATIQASQVCAQAVSWTLSPWPILALHCAQHTAA